MAYAADAVVFVAGAGVDVHPNAGEGAWEGFAGDADAIFEGGDLVEVGGVLNTISFGTYSA